MRILHSYLLRSVLRVTLYAVLFFSAIVILLDLFTNLNMYISNDVPLSQVLYLSYLYIPKAITYAISPSILFGVTFTISNMHSRNELVSILNSGISYYRFIDVILIMGLLAGGMNFLFQEYVVIDSFTKKSELSNTLIGYSTSYNNSNVVLLSQDSNNIYYARYYNDKRSELSNIILLIRDSEGSLLSRVDAKKATYSRDTNEWILEEVKKYEIEDGRVSSTYLRSDHLSGSYFLPEDFRDITYNIQEMRIPEAKMYLKRIRFLDLQRYRILLTDYYERFSFSLTPFIVAIISCSLGSRFKKNILLYSLLLCIIISVFYYIFEMLTILLAKQNYLPPVIGAWLPVIVFSIASLISLRRVRT